MPTLLVLFGVFSLAFINARAPQSAYATASTTVNFQARLQANGGTVVPDGTYNVEFKLYDASSSSGSSQGSCTSDSHCLWTETRTGGNKVTVSGGYLTAQLGSVTSFPSAIDWSQQLWLTMNIGGTGSASWDGEMNPRLQLTAVPYAFQAAKAATADQLSKTSGGNTSTLAIQSPTGGGQTFQIQDQGTSGTFNILTAPSGSDGYIKLQGASPSQQTGYFNISGLGIAASLQAGSLDTSSAATLTIGGSNANAITIGHSSAQVNVPGNIFVGVSSSNAGQITFANASNSNTATIKSDVTASSYTTLLPTSIGTTGYCLYVQGVVGTTQSLGYATCGAGGGGGGGVTLQGGTPGTADAGNINITGTAIASALQASSLDTSSAGTLAIGDSTATTIDVGTGAIAHTINIGTGAAAQAITIGSGTGASGVTFRAGTGGMGFSIQGTTTETIDAAGNFSIKPLNNNAYALHVQDSASSDLLIVDATTGTTLVHDLQVQSGGSLDVAGGFIRLAGTQQTTFRTPGTNGDGSNGADIATKINIPIFDPGAFNQIIALGLPSSAATSSRVILAVDARTSAHQPTIAVLSPGENDIFGLSWEGSNTVASLKTTSSTISLQSGGHDVLQAVGTSGASTVTIGDGSNSGTLRAITVLQAPSLDTISSGALTIGGTNATSLGIGNTSSNIATTVNGTAVFKPTSGNDSTTAFQIQKANGTTNLFTVDSTNQKVLIGPSGGDSTGTILVLGSKTGSASDPTGTNGAMYYNATSGEFRCYAEGIWRDCMASARSSFHYTNDFITTSEDAVGTPFNFGANSGVGQPSTPSEAGHPGLLAMGPGDSGAGTVGFATRGTDKVFTLGGGDYWHFESDVKVDTLSNGTDRYNLRSGFRDGINNDDTLQNGCYLKYSDNVNSGKWQGVCSDGGSVSTCDAGVTVASGTWYRLTLAVNSAGNSVDFQVDGVSKCQVTSHIPVGAGHEVGFGVVQGAVSGTGDPLINVDYIDISAQFGSSR